MKLGLLAAACFLFLFGHQQSARGATEPLPNFIIVFCDDMGYADIGPFGAEGYKTPNLDRMAREGMTP